MSKLAHVFVLPDAPTMIVFDSAIRLDDHHAKALFHNSPKMPTEIMTHHGRPVSLGHLELRRESDGHET